MSRKPIERLHCNAIQTSTHPRRDRRQSSSSRTCGKPMTSFETRRSAAPLKLFIVGPEAANVFRQVLQHPSCEDIREGPDLPAHRIWNVAGTKLGKGRGTNQDPDWEPTVFHLWPPLLQTTFGLLVAQRLWDAPTKDKKPKSLHLTGKMLCRLRPDGFVGILKVPVCWKFVAALKEEKCHGASRSPWLKPAARRPWVFSPSSWMCQQIDCDGPRTSGKTSRAWNL
mmetsp:Transcript_90114/g.143480  ORF Transcript_90114/g.143480 Transcript_90114/m.143480 type:complete len:225 (+) Transcript_90114:123-797(+)